MSTYTDFSASKPSGSSTGATFATDANSNDVALWYAVVIGGAKGYAFSQSGGTAEEPGTFLWTNGAQIVKSVNTWASGNLTQQVWSVSQDTGGSYAAVCTQTFTYDGSGNLTATTNSGGMLDFLKYLLGRVKNHILGSGTAVHGLGSMSTQSAASVAITGGSMSGVAVTTGSINNTPIGVTTPAEIRSFRTSEKPEYLTPSASAAVTWDWTYGATVMTNNGTHVVSFSNVVPNTYMGTHFFDVTNFNNTTFPVAVSWGVAGKPSIAGRAQGTIVTTDGGSTYTGTVSWRAV